MGTVGLWLAVQSGEKGRFEERKGLRQLESSSLRKSGKGTRR
jgi:hypothetical protein